MIDIEKLKIRTNGYEFINAGNTAIFPTEIFPEKIQHVIKSLKENATFEPQIIGSTILFVASTIIGLSKKIIVKNGTWEDTPNLWIAVVGRRGTMKTPATSYALKPLVNDEKDYASRFEFDLAEFYKTPKKERDDENRPKRRQRFSNDTTVEGLIDAMQTNFNGMGIYKDELNGFFEEMNRYKSGGNLEFYLSAFSGGIYVKNRKSYDTQTINDIYLSMLGSIQPEVLSEIAKMQINNGMLDRWLYTLSDNIVPHTTDNEIPQIITDEYKKFIATISNNCTENSILEWMPDAKTVFFTGVNEMESMMADENCDPMLFTYLSKMKTYFARFITIITIMNNTDIITIEFVNHAVKLVAYYIHTATNIFIGFDNKLTLDSIYKSEFATTKKQKVIAIVKHLPDLNNTEISSITGISRQYIIKCKQ